MNFQNFNDFEQATLVDLFDYAKESTNSVTFFDFGIEDQSVTYGELYNISSKIAAYFQSRNIGAGETIAYFGGTNLATIYLIQAALMAGAIPVLLPLPLRVSYVEEFVTELKRRLVQINPKITIVDDEVDGYISKSDFITPFITSNELIKISKEKNLSYVKPNIDPDSTVLLQFTSGTTGEPKGVPFNTSQIVSHIKSLIEATKANPATDTILSWVPLYHNMGLVGMTLMPLVLGCKLAITRPQHFILEPLCWAKNIERFKATVSVGPDFAYGHLARALQNRAKEDSSPFDLSTLRIALTGTNKVDPDIMKHFISVAKLHGFNEDAICCAYGVTECTLAVTFPELGVGLDIDRVDRSVMQAKYIAESPSSVTDELWIEEFVVLGRPLNGIKVRICHEVTGEILGERHVGEIQIRGTSVATEYFHNEVLTSRRFVEGWLKTGDLGYMFDSKLVVICKISDKITLRSQWFAPEELENLVALHPAVRPGNVVALQVPDSNSEPKVVIIAETKQFENFGLVTEDIEIMLRRAFGIDNVTISFIPAGTLPKTTSGKFQRNLTRGLYLTGKLPRLY